MKSSLQGMHELEQEISTAVKKLFNVDVNVQLTRPAEQFGDYTTNVALQLANKTGKKPQEIASQISANLKHESIAKSETAGPGFINITLTDKTLLSLLDSEPPKTYNGKTVVIEHTDPNPFKEFHIGHAYSNTVGESIGRLMKAAGAKVHQVSYHGDAGLHIAMAIWGMKKQLNGKELNNIPENERHEFLAKSYAMGAKANKESETATNEIKEINKHIYARDDEVLNNLYDTGRQWSLAYFENIYKKINVNFEKQYFETDTGKTGQEIVKQNQNVFEVSEGAIIYKGEKAGLHTRVFITKEGLPTYEAKELGLAYAKQKDYPDAEKFIVITANEIDEYFKVLIAAIKEIDEKLAKKIIHISHGVVKLPSGKMSSRTGEVITLNEVWEMLETAVKKTAKDTPALKANVMAALKYTFLKHRLGGDLIFDIDESISLEGNSGPYLQYAHARACSILEKSPVKTEDKRQEAADLDPSERSLVRKISEYPEVVESAVKELLPSHICTYLYELAQIFNRFYENNRVIGDKREALRIRLVKVYKQILENGLAILNIPAPDKM